MLKSAAQLVDDLFYKLAKDPLAVRAMYGAIDSPLGNNPRAHGSAGGGIAKGVGSSTSAAQRSTKNLSGAGHIPQVEIGNALPLYKSTITTRSPVKRQAATPPPTTPPPTTPQYTQRTLDDWNTVSTRAPGEPGPTVAAQNMQRPSSQPRNRYAQNTF